jgi:hypothetical protein
LTNIALTKKKIRIKYYFFLISNGNLSVSTQHLHFSVLWRISISYKMANQENLPLYEKTWLKRTFQRAIDILILLLLFSLLSYRLFSINNTFTLPWFLAFLCESWFTYTWIVLLNTKWSPAITKTHPNRLLQRYVL